MELQAVTRGAVCFSFFIRKKAMKSFDPQVCRSDEVYLSGAGLSPSSKHCRRNARTARPRDTQPPVYKKSLLPWKPWTSEDDLNSFRLVPGT